MAGWQHRFIVLFVVLFATVIGLALSGSPAAAGNWRTHHFIPVPYTPTSKLTIPPLPTNKYNTIAKNVLEGFVEYSTDKTNYVNGASVLTAGDGLGVIAVKQLKFDALSKGAPQALQEIFNLVRRDAKRMDAGGFPSPDIEPILYDKSRKQNYFPVFWDKLSDGTFQWGGCVPRRPQTPVRVYINANQNAFPFSRLHKAWVAGGKRRETMLVYMSSQLTHEVVHAVQNASTSNHNGKRGICRSDPKWWAEGTADGTAYYLTSLRMKHVFDKYPFTRNERRYDYSLDARQVHKDKKGDINYATGSFFRYLMEASGETRIDGIKMAKDLVGIQPASKKDNTHYIKAIDRIIKKHTHNRRGLYQVLPEFLTEYASYGHARYTKLSATGWIKKAFHGCQELTVGPGQKNSVSVTVNPLAGECIKVHYALFKTATALQMSVTGDGNVDFGALHLGEALRGDVASSIRRYCYAVTKKIPYRLTHQMNEKCILKRGALSIRGQSGGARKEATWTSDFDAFGSGDVYYVLTNIAKDVTNSKRYTLKFQVGALQMKEAEGKKITPQKPGGEKKPVEHGMTVIKKRVYALAAPGGHPLIDGRDIVSGAQKQQAERLVKSSGAKASMAIVFSGDYWVTFGSPGKGSPLEKLGDTAMIIKSPHRFGGGMGLISSAGAARLAKGHKCGYEIPAKMRTQEISKDKLVFQVSGDLFDMSKILSINPGGSDCDKLKQLWVEHASFKISLPNGQLYAPDTHVKVMHPPGQKIYGKEFLPGPNFGGIATSKSLLEEGPPPNNPWEDGGPSRTKKHAGPKPGLGPGIGGISGGKSGWSGSQMSQVAGRACKMMAQQADFAGATAQMLPMIMQSVEALHCTCEFAKQMHDPARKNNFSPALRNAILAKAGHCSS